LAALRGDVRFSREKDGAAPLVENWTAEFNAGKRRFGAKNQKTPSKTVRLDLERGGLGTFS